MNLKNIIEKKDAAAQFMIDEITHICTKFEKRAPGSKGEKQACEYMAKQMKEKQRLLNPITAVVIILIGLLVCV